jgi:hypothetical protein
MLPAPPVRCAVPRARLDMSSVRTTAANGFATLGTSTQVSTGVSVAIRDTSGTHSYRFTGTMTAPSMSAS